MVPQSFSSVGYEGFGARNETILAVRVGTDSVDGVLISIELADARETL